MLGSSLGSFSRVIKTETRMGSRLSPFAPTIIKPINFGTINNIHVFFQRGFFCSFLFQSSLLFQSCGMTCSMSAFGRCTMVRSFVAFIFYLTAFILLLITLEFSSFDVNLAKNVDAFKSRISTPSFPKGKDLGEFTLQVFPSQIRWDISQIQSNSGSNDVLNHDNSGDKFPSQSARKTQLIQESLSLVNIDHLSSKSGLEDETIINILNVESNKVQHRNETPGPSTYLAQINQLTIKVDHLPRCTHGIDVQSRRRFWSYFDDIHPALFDAFAKDGTLLLLFTVRGDLCSNCKPVTRVTSAIWTCTFDGHTDVAGLLVVNGEGPVNSVVVECKIPALLPNNRLSVGETVSVSFKETGMDAHHYRDVPFCRYPGPEAWRQAVAPVRDAAAGRSDALPPVPLAVCTMLKSTLTRYGKRDADLLMEWIAYHRLQGVGHFLIYAHEEATPLRRLLAPHIAEGLAEVVDWESPPYNNPGAHRGSEFVPYQYLQTTSCLHRYRGLAEWVGLFDIDEFMQPLAPAATVRSAVFEAAAAADAKHSNVAALKVAGVYFFEKEGRRWGNSSLMTQRHLKRDRKWRFQVGKCFGRPERIQLYQQHFPTMGGAIVELDPERVMRFNHYRNTYFDAVEDTSMAQYREALEAELRVGGARSRAENGTLRTP